MFMRFYLKIFILLEDILFEYNIRVINDLITGIVHLKMKIL